MSIYLDRADRLDDDLADLDIFAPSPMSAESIAAGIKLATEAPQYRMHEESCRKCRGSGRFVSYSGRVLGDCFACKGKGKVYYRQSLAERQKRAEQAAARKQAQATSFAEQHPEIMAWIAKAAPRFDFAASLRDQIMRKGALSERQTAVREAKAVDLSGLHRAFKAALASGLKRPVLRLAEFKFKEAPASGQNAGFIYAIRDTDDTYLGKIGPDSKLIKVRACTPADESAIIEACADPEAAAVAYGRRTGACSCCGRELTKQESIDRGIGPVCASKWGW
jgi:hypothetical protein